MVLKACGGSGGLMFGIIGGHWGGLSWDLQIDQQGLPRIAVFRFGAPLGLMCSLFGAEDVLETDLGPFWNRFWFLLGYFWDVFGFFLVYCFFRFLKLVGK